MRNDLPVTGLVNMLIEIQLRYSGGAGGALAWEIYRPSTEQSCPSTKCSPIRFAIAGCALQYPGFKTRLTTIKSHSRTVSK